MSYGAPPPPSYQPPANHPQTTTVLVLGIVGLVACQILGPFAWVMGNRVVAEIDASGGAYGGRDTANIGRILGIVATVLLGLTILALVFFIVVAGGLAASSNA
jgi:uncharacterized membrane protein YjgN (DUF898 family)